ncbi:MAG: peroxiredoxin [Acidimicrobiales bacterium]
MAIEIGDEAPDFDLVGPNFKPVRLSDFRGTPVALVFYPFSFTSVCGAELCRLRDDYAKFENAGLQVLAVSCDAPGAQRAWSEQQNYQFPLLSDFWPHGAAARRYGVFDDGLGYAKRATFFIDESGRVVDRFGSDELRTPRAPERYDEALTRL